MKLFTHVVHENVIRPFVKMLDRTDGHYYQTRTGKIYPSITTILKILTKAGINAWRDRIGWANADRISQESTEVGTVLHSIIEHFLNNQPLSVVEEYKYAISPMKLFEAIKPILADIDNIHALEMKLYSDEMGIAGTVDCVAEFEGKLSIIDFKNSRKRKTKSMVKNYELQVTAYKNMWKECMNMDIEQGVIIIANWDGGKGEPAGQVFKTKIEENQTELWRVLVQHEESLI